MDILIEMGYQYQPTFYDKWFSRYRILANSAEFSHYEVMKPCSACPQTCILAFSERVWL